MNVIERGLLEFKLASRKATGNADASAARQSPIKALCLKNTEEFVCVKYTIIITKTVNLIWWMTIVK